MKLCEEEFLWAIKKIVKLNMPAHDIVKEAILQRENFHPTKEVIFLERPCPWKAHLFEIEKVEKCQG